MEIDKALLSAIEIGQTSTGKIISNADGDQFVLLPSINGWSSQKIFDAEEPPKFIDAEYNFSNITSLSLFFNRFKEFWPEAIAYRCRKEIVICFDENKNSTSGRRKFYARFVPTLSDEWNLWVENDSHEREQLAFANFIEECAEDIIDPDGATMLEIVSTLQSTASLRFKSGVNLGNGNRKLTFEESSSDHAGEHAQLEIPQVFTIKIPIFERNDLHATIKARFRYRRHSNGVKMSYKLVRPQRALDSAMDAFQKEFEEKAKIKCLSLA